MDLTLSADQQALQSGLRDLLAGIWSADELRAASCGDASKDPWGQIAAMGVFGVTAPESEGGMGFGLADAAVLFEELGAALVPGPLVPTVLSAGRVPGVIEGTAAVAVLDLRTSARVVEHLGAATHVLLLEDDGLRLTTPDVLKAEPLATPLDPLTPVWVVSAAQDLGGVGETLGGADVALDFTRRAALLTAALQVGVSRGALDLAVRYAQERVQFDRVIGSFQAVKHLLAESLVRVDLARAAVLVAALVVDDPEATEQDDEVSAAKLLADDAATLNGRTGIQVHGGMGFTWEVLAHLYVKRAWLQATAFGDTDEHAARLATGIELANAVKEGAQ
ncbi:MAG TPA: acyl-CoA dehydrogenase family protein [Jatrophihabitans sp.]|jgi:alkylation response protein AidB-like acyl-CoA dehydrogenase